MRVLDSRRVRGPSLASRSPGALAEVALEDGETQETAEAAWRAQLADLSALVGRPELAQGAVVRRFAGADHTGLALMVPAPIDVLRAVVDLNELAIEAATYALRAEPRPFGDRTIADLVDDLAFLSLPRLVALKEQAARKGLPFVYDGDAATVGLCGRSRTYPVDELPAIDEVPWETLGRVPFAFVTGTNGKTTTTRLVARMAAEAGFVAGHTSSDGVVVGGHTIERGDWTGGEAARLVLRHEAVELAILETARGGILRRGLAVDGADAALITNISADHLGEYGVPDLATMAELKAVVGHAVRPGGRVILNADDPELARLARTFAAEVVLFSVSGEGDVLASHLARGAEAFVVNDGAIVRRARGERDVLVSIAEVPLTRGGVARHNVENALGAAALGHALGLPRAAILAALRHFGERPDDNPGRGQIRELAPGVRGLFDFAHNPAGIELLYEVARSLVGEGAKIVSVLTQAGDRSDADLETLCASVVRGGASAAVVWEKESLLRGRAPGELRERLRAGFRAHGIAEDALRVADDEAGAVQHALAMASPGDLVVVAPYLTR
jgi:cyanophycin synthetase